MRSDNRATSWKGSGGMSPWFQVILLVCVHVQVGFVGAKQQPSSIASSSSSFCSRGLSITGGADPSGGTEEEKPSAVDENKEIAGKRRVRRRVKRRRSMSHSQSQSPSSSNTTSSGIFQPPSIDSTSRPSLSIPTVTEETSISVEARGRTTKKNANDSVDSVATKNVAFVSKKQKKKAKKAETKTRTKGISKHGGNKRSVGGGKEGECLRRIKREMKDAAKLGVLYDWGDRRTIRGKGKNAKAMDPKYNYVRMGPMGKNLLSWHFSVQGAPNSVYEEGIYHGRVLLPKNYPASPPRVQMLTKSGRFVPEVDICLSASSYHPESWTPRWTVLSLIDALRLHMLTSANEIGGINASNEVRRKRAIESRTWSRGVVDHAQMLQDGIFKGDEEDMESERTDSVQSITSNENDPSSEVLLGMVTQKAIERHEERTKARELKKDAKMKVDVFMVKVLFRTAIAILTSPLKLGLFIFGIIFVRLNTR